MPDVVHVEDVRGGGFLVSLDCGHKLATRVRALSYPCRVCRPGSEEQRGNVSTLLAVADIVERALSGTINEESGPRVLAEVQLALEHAEPTEATGA